jgi:hypothetical protein
MLPRPTLVKSGPPRQSPQRAALADAIAAFNSNEESVKSLQSAVQEATDKYWKSVRDRNVAEEVLRDVDEKEAEYLADLACGKPNQKPISRAAAEADLAEADRKQASHKRVKELLEGRLAEATHPFRRNPDKVRKAALAVIESEIDFKAIFAEVEAMQRALVDKRLKLQWLSKNDCVPPAPRLDLGYTPQPPFNPDGDWYLPSTQLDTVKQKGWWRELEGNVLYEKALQALMTDAAAPVPRF